MLATRLTLFAVCLAVTGCDTAGGLYGGNDNPMTNNGNANAGSGDDGATTLGPIKFAADLPRGEDPATLAIGDGSIDFAGGSAGTLGIIPLYFDDAFAWDLAAGGTATITFNDLDVSAVRFYFAHKGGVGATAVAEDADGATLDMASSFAATALGDARAVLSMDAGDGLIARLVIDVPEGAIVAIDEVTVTLAATDEP